MEVDPKLFPVNTKKVECIGEDNQVIADHIHEVVLPIHMDTLSFPVHTTLPYWLVGQDEHPAGKVPHQGREGYTPNLVEK